MVDREKGDGLLAGRVALITGGAGDIAQAILRRYRAAGARVALLDIDGPRLIDKVASAGLAGTTIPVRHCEEGGSPTK